VCGRGAFSKGRTFSPALFSVISLLLIFLRRSFNPELSLFSHEQGSLSYSCLSDLSEVNQSFPLQSPTLPIRVNSESVSPFFFLIILEGFSLLPLGS